MSFQIHAAKGIKGLFPELQMSAVYFHHDARDWKELCNFVNVHTWKFWWKEKHNNMNLSLENMKIMTNLPKCK